MERLQDLLVNYNKARIPEEARRSWSNQFCELHFPYYWYKVYDILKRFDKDKRVVEIGCGQGDVTSIACYLGFASIRAYERDPQMSKVAYDKIMALFHRSDVIVQKSYPDVSQEEADILVMVNCVYADNAITKEEYRAKIRIFYEAAGFPKWFILEAIDTSYSIADDNFPYHIRLNEGDIATIFPQSNIASWETYHYPENKRTKRLYLIERQ